MAEPVNEKRAAEHAALWKADHGQAPHYSRSFAGLGWTCWACPLDDCDWHHDEPVQGPTTAGTVDALVREHLGSHDVADFLQSLQRARESNVAVRESNNRAWDVVQVHRLRTAQRGEHPSTDPVAQMLSAALVGSNEHEVVRDEIRALEGDTHHPSSASVPVAERLAPATSSPARPKTFQEVMDDFFGAVNARKEGP